MARSLRSRGSEMECSHARGFTLAEVLITLAIIGIVAALTIPTVVKNYQKQQLVTALKVEYANLSKGFQTMMATEGVTNMQNTSFVKECSPMANNQTYYDCVIKNLGKYIGIVKVDSKIHYYKYLNSTATGSTSSRLGANHVFMLKNGMWVTFGEVGLAQIVLFGIIDVNGEKQPNTGGRDIFDIVLLDNGSLIFRQSKKYSIMVSDPISNYWRSGTLNTNCSTTATSNGRGCGARIQEEGWKMNY